MGQMERKRFLWRTVWRITSFWNQLAHQHDPQEVFPADALAEKAAVCCAEELVEGHAAAELVVKEVINDSASQPGPRPFMKPYIPRLPLPLAQNLLNLPSAEACPPQAILPAKTQPKARNGDKGIHCFGYICSIRCSRK